MLSSATVKLRSHPFSSEQGGEELLTAAVERGPSISPAHPADAEASALPAGARSGSKKVPRPVVRL